MKYNNLTSDNISKKCNCFGISSQHCSLIFNQLNHKGLSHRQILDAIIITNDNDLFNKFAPIIGITLFSESMPKCDDYPNP
jgi:hypothetical protein